MAIMVNDRCEEEDSYLKRVIRHRNTRVHMAVVPTVCTRVRCFEGFVVGRCSSLVSQFSRKLSVKLNNYEISKFEIKNRNISRAYVLHSQ